MIRSVPILAYALCLAFTLVSPWAHGQTDPEEAYDPFSDYSEFDENSDEEADINFFRNGRFFTVGLAVGPQSFTDGMDKAYGDGPTMGVYLAYFLDLNLALSLSLNSADHSVVLKTTSQEYSGNVSFSNVGLHLKYYLNTQNVTKGLADLNPYLIGGFSQVTRSYTIAELLTQTKDTVTSSDLGVGIEIPLMRRKAYFGVQALYNFLNFSDENRRFVNGIDPLRYKINGDILNTQFILGMNF
jgi:hypothetical protein